MSEHFDLTLQGRLGFGKSDGKEIRILNRILRAVPGQGVELEADPRHAEEVVRSMELVSGHSKMVTTPGVKDTIEQIRDDVPLDADQCTPFRAAAAARLNYMAVDRTDCQFCATELCRLMDHPTDRGWAALKRLTRFLMYRPRLVHAFPIQQLVTIRV